VAAAAAFFSFSAFADLRLQSVLAIDHSALDRVWNSDEGQLSLEGSGLHLKTRCYRQAISIKWQIIPRKKRYDP